MVLHVSALNVWRGLAPKTHNGYTRRMLFRNPHGQVKRRKISLRTERNPHLRMWRAAVMYARKDLKTKGFSTIKGPLLARARMYYYHHAMSK
jgi:hypothetical protein